MPEVFGTLSALRADVIAAPMGAPSGVTMQEDPKLFNQPYPPDTPFAPMAAAKLGQTWVVMSGWSDGQARFSRRLRAGTGDRDSAASSPARQERDRDADHDRVAGDMAESNPPDRRPTSRDHVADHARSRVVMLPAVGECSRLEVRLLRDTDQLGGHRTLLCRVQGTQVFITRPPRPEDLKARASTGFVIRPFMRWFLSAKC